MKRIFLIIALQLALIVGVSAQSSNVWQVSDDLTGDALVEAIVEPFEGTVVLIDVWGTWCGPCKAAMKTIEPLKEEMQGEDVSFLYLACGNSPKQTWSEMIPDIHGEHYYITTDQWNEILKKYGAGGVPLYIMFDKNGNFVGKWTGFPGVDKMREQINIYL